MSRLCLPPRALDAERGWIRAVCGRRTCPPALRALDEAELSACCAVAASSSTFNCWRTRRSSEVAASGQLCSSMAATARFCDTRQKSGGPSASALPSMFTPSLARRLLSRSGPRADGVGAQSCGYSAAGRRSRRSLFPSQGPSCMRMSYAGRWSQGSASMPSSC
jgi:hypothetical protein